jgi:hypothetical protein
MSAKELSDPVIDEVRAIRRRISAQFDHDPVKLVAHYIELQKRHADRLIGGAGKSAPEDDLVEGSGPIATSGVASRSY